MKVAGTRVLLTGASGGIGHAVARALAAKGASLVITGRRDDALRPLAGELGAEVIVIDLSKRDSIDALVAQAGQVDILVANAGLPCSGDVLEFSPEEIDRAIDVNLRAPMQLARALAPAMVERGRGHIVMTSSLSGKSSQAATGIYSATKFGLRGFGQGLRLDLAPHGVGVSVLFPGFIRDAGMFHNSGAVLPRSVGTSSPEQVGDAVVKAIERNRGEIDVAPLPMRLGTMIAGVAPELAARVARRAGGDEIAAQMVPAQKHLR